MNSPKRTARLAGLFYVLMSIPGVFSAFYIPVAFVVSGDATATARKIAEGAFVYRMGVVSDLASHVLFLLLALTLYRLFKDVDRVLARLLVMLVSVGVAVGIANEVSQYAPLVLLSDKAYLSVFTKPQLNALALGFLGLHNGGLATAEVFWGLWLLPFGRLVMKSGYFPKILGVLLIIGCFAYLVSSLAYLALPAYHRLIFQIVSPLFALAEVPMMFWLLIAGAKERPAEVQPALAG